MQRKHLIELFENGSLVSTSGKETCPVRQCQDIKVRLAIGRLLCKHGLRQEHRETIEGFASRVREKLAPPAGHGLVQDCLRGTVLEKGEKHRKTTGVIVFVILNGNDPLYLFGPWVWFHECERLARKRFRPHNR